MSEKEEFKNNNSNICDEDNNPFNVGIVFLEPLLPCKEFEEMKSKKY